MILFRVLCTAIVICAIIQSSTGRSLERTKRDAEEAKEQDTQSYTEDAEGTTTEESAIDRRFITMNQDDHFDVIVQKSHDFSALYDNEDETSSESIHGNNNDINELLSKIQSNMAFNKDAVYPSGMHFSNANDMKSSNLQDMLQSMMVQNGGQLDDEQSIKNIMSMMGGGQENAGGAQFSFQQPASFNWQNMAGSGGNTASLDVDSIIQMLAQQYNIGAEQEEFLKSQMKHMDAEQLQQLLNMVTMFGNAEGQVTMNDGNVAPQFDASQITMSQDEMASLLEMLKQRGYSQSSPNVPIQIDQSQLEELLKMIKLKANGGDGKMAWNTDQTKDVNHQIEIQVTDESNENPDDGNMDMEQLMKLIMSLQGGGEEKTPQLNIDPRILQMLMKLSAGLPKSPEGLPKEMAVNLNPDLLKYLMHMMQNKPKHPVEGLGDVGGDEMSKILQLLQSGKPQYKRPMEAGFEPASGKPSHDDLLKLLQMLGPKVKEQDKVIQIRIPGYDKPAPAEIDWDKILNMIPKNPQIVGGLQSKPQKGELPDWLLNLIKNMKKKPSGFSPQQEIGPQVNEQHDETDTNLPDQMPDLADILKLFNKPKKPNSKQPSYNKDENLPDTNGEENQPDLSDIWNLLKSFGTTPAPSSKYPNIMSSSGKKPRHPSYPDQPEDNDANLPVSNKTPGFSSLLNDLFNFASDNDKKTTPRPRPSNWPNRGPGSAPFRPDYDQTQYPNQIDKNPKEDEENLPMGHSPDNSSGGFSYGSQESTYYDEDDQNLPLQYPTDNTPGNDPYGPQYPYRTTTEKSLLSKILDFLNSPEDPEENDENLPMDHTVDKRPYWPRYPQETTTKRPSFSKIFFKLFKPKGGSDEDDANLPMTQPTEHPDDTGPNRPTYPIESKSQPNLTNLILTLLNPTYNPENEATVESREDWYPSTTKKPSLSDIFTLFNPDKNKKPSNRPGYRPNYYPKLTHDPSSPDFFNPLDIYSPKGQEPDDNGDYQPVHHKTTTTHVIKIINITGEQPTGTNRPRFPGLGVYIPNNNSPFEDTPEEPDPDGNQNTNILKQIFNNLNPKPPSLKPTPRPQTIRPTISFQPPSRPPGTLNLLNTIMHYFIDKNKYEIDDFTTKQPFILPIPTIEPILNPLDQGKIAPYPSPPNQPREIDVYFPHYKDPTLIAPYETEAIDDEGRPVSPEWLPLVDKAVYLANEFFPNQVTDVMFMPDSSNNNVGFLPSLLDLIKSSVSGDTPKPDEPKNPKRDTLQNWLLKTIFSSSLPSTDRPEYPQEEPFLTRFVKNLVKASFPEFVPPTYPPTSVDSTKPSLLFDRNVTNLQHLDSPLDVLLGFLKQANDPEGSDPLRDVEGPRRPSLVRIILSILGSNSPVEDYPSKPSPLWPFYPKRPSDYPLSLTKTIINLLRSEFSTTDPLEDSALFPKPWTPSHSKPRDESILDLILPLLDSSIPSGGKNKHPFLPGDSEEDLLQPSRTRRPSILDYLLPLLDSSIPSTDKNKYPFPENIDSPFDELFNPDKERPSLLKSMMNMLLISSDPNYPSDSSSDLPDLWHPRPRPDKEPNDRHKSILYYILLLLQSNLKPLEEEILNHIKKPPSPWDPFNSLNHLWPEKWPPKLIPDTALPMWERFTQLASFAPTALTGLLSMLYSGSPSIDPWTGTPNEPNSGGIIPSLESSYDPEDGPSLLDDHTPGTQAREKSSNWLKEITSTSSSLGERPSKIKRPSDLMEHFPWPLNITYPTRDPSSLRPRNELLFILDSSTPLGSKQNNGPSSWFADPNKSPKDKPRTTLDYLLPFFDSSTPSSIMDDSPSSGKKPESIRSRLIKTIFSFSILQSVHIPGSTTRTPDSTDLDSLIWYIIPSSLKKLFGISRIPESDSPDSPNKRPGTLSKRPSLTREILSILRSDPSDDSSTSKYPELGKREGPLRHIWRSIEDVSNYLFSNPTTEPKDKHPHPMIDLLRPEDSILKRILNLLRSSDPHYPSEEEEQPKDPFDIFNWPQNPLLPKYDSKDKKSSLFGIILSILISNPEPSIWLDPLSPSNQRPDFGTTDLTRPSLTNEILSFLDSNPNRDDPISFPSRDKPGNIPSMDIERYPLPDVLNNKKGPSFIRSILSILLSNPEPSNWLDPLSPSNQTPDSRPSLTDEILLFLGSNPNRDDPISIPSRDGERYLYLPKPKDSFLKRILNLLRSSNPEVPSKQEEQPKDPFDIFDWPRNPLLPKYHSKDKKRPSLFGIILSILISNPDPSNWLDPLSPSNQRPDFGTTDRTRPSLTDEILSFLGSNPNRDDPISIPSRDGERYPYIPQPEHSILKRILNLLRSSIPESPSKQEEQPKDPFDIFNWSPNPLLPKYDSEDKKRPSLFGLILSILLSNPEPSNWLDPLSPSNQTPVSGPSLTDEILSFLGSNPNRDDPNPSLEPTLDFPNTYRRPSLFKDILTVFDSSRILPDNLLPGRDQKYPDSKPGLPRILDFPKREKKPSLFGDILSLFDSSKPPADKDRRPSIISDILTSLHSNPTRDTPLFPSPDFSWLPKWLRPMNGDKLYGHITFDNMSEICSKLLNTRLVPSVFPSAITNIFGPLDDNIDPIETLKNLLRPSSSAMVKEFPSMFPSWDELFAVSVGDKSEIDLFKPKSENHLFPSKFDTFGTSKNPFKELKDLFKLPDLEESKISFSLSGTVLNFLTKLTTDPWSLKDDDDIKRDTRLISLIQKISNLNISDRQKIYDCLRLKTLIASEKEEIDCDLVKLLMKLKFPKLTEAEINNLIAQQVSNHLQSMTYRR